MFYRSAVFGGRCKFRMQFAEYLRGAAILFRVSLETRKSFLLLFFKKEVLA
jgi:hypothetical protein